MKIRGVAQSGSAPGLGPGGREFESRRPDQISARSSIGWSIGLLSRGLQVRFLPGAPALFFNFPLRRRMKFFMVVVAQLVEPRIVVPVVVGSSPISHPMPI